MRGKLKINIFTETHGRLLFIWVLSVFCFSFVLPIQQYSYWILLWKLNREAEFVLFFSEKFCRLLCPVNSLVTPTGAGDGAVTGAGLCTLGETVIISFVVSVTRNRHHRAFRSCQPSVFRESDSPTPNFMKQPVLEEAPVLEHNFHPAFLFFIHRPDESSRCQNYRTLLERPTPSWHFTVEYLLQIHTFQGFLWSCWDETGSCWIHGYSPPPSHTCQSPCPLHNDQREAWLQ